MKYLILAHMSQRTWDELSAAEVESPTGLRALGDFLQTFVAELTASGELVDSGGLDAPARARRVELRAGESFVTDGPFAETQEVLAGYWLVDCADLDRATEIAARLDEAPGPSSRTGVIVRQLL